MTDIQIWQPHGAEITAYDPPSGPLDDWIRVADQVVNLAKVIADSPFVPDGLRGNVAATAAAILTGRELNIPPMTSLANIHVIHGRPGLSALVMRALIQSHGHEWRDVEVTNTRVVVEGRRKGSSEWTRAGFSADDATRARIQLGGYPQDKLYARATARLARRAFADVIAGMPYAAEELEDGITEDDTPAAEAATTTQPAAGPKPRTAQRKQRTPDASPAHAAANVAAPAPPPTPQGAGEALPPLPGEDEERPTGAADAAATDSTGALASTQDAQPDDSDYDTPGTVTTPQITAIWTVLSTVYGFTKDEKDQARTVCAAIINRDLTTTTHLSRNEAKAILDTLSHWSEQAGQKGEHPRDYMIVMLAAQDGASDE